MNEIFLKRKKEIEAIKSKITDTFEIHIKYITF